MGELTDDMLAVDAATSLAGGMPTTTSIAGRHRRKPVGGPMNLEEIRMNKNLLREIGQMKK